MSLDNPAGRLYALLEEADVPPKGNDSTPVRHRWADVLGIHRNDLPTLLARLSEVMALPSQVRAAIESVPEEDKERFLEPIPKIEQAFAKLNLAQQWKQFAEPITQNVMTGLSFCDWLLSKSSPEPVIGDEQRERIHEEIRDLRDDVRANEEDDDLRRFLLRHLNAMDEALHEYKLSGAPPVEEAIHAAVGDSFFRFLRGETLPRNSRWDRFWLAAHRLSIALHIVTAGIALPQTVSSMEESVVVIELEEQAEDNGGGESGGQGDGGQENQGEED